MPPRERAKRGQIYIVDFEDHECRGTEQKKKRPWVILSSDLLNSDKDIKGYIAAPLTTQTHKKSEPFRLLIEMRVKGRPENSLVLLEQLRFISEERLNEKPIWALDAKTLAKLEIGLYYILHLLHS